MVYSWEDVAIFMLSGYDFIPFLVEEVTLPEARALIDEIRPAGNAWMRRFDSGGRETLRPLSHTCVYSGETAAAGVASPNALLASLPMAGSVVIGIEGNVAGRNAICGLVKTSTYERVPASGKLLRVKAESMIDGRLSQGILLHAETAESADFDTEAASVNNGWAAAAVNITSSSIANPTHVVTAAPHLLQSTDTVTIAGHITADPDINGIHVITYVNATEFTIAVNVTTGGTGGTVRRSNTRAGGRAFFQLPDQAYDGDGVAYHPFTLGGYTNLVLDVRGSADDSTFAALATATALTARGDQVIEVVGNVPRYIACGGDFTGAGAAPAASPVIVFERYPE